MWKRIGRGKYLSLNPLQIGSEVKLNFHSKEAELDAESQSPSDRVRGETVNIQNNEISIATIESQSPSDRVRGETHQMEHIHCILNLRLNPLQIGSEVKQLKFLELI